MVYVHHFYYLYICNATASLTDFRWYWVGCNEINDIIDNSRDVLRLEKVWNKKQALHQHVPKENNKKIYIYVCTYFMYNLIYLFLDINKKKLNAFQ